MQFLMITSDKTIISRLQQLGSAMQRQEKLVAAAENTHLGINPKAFGALRFNNPAGTLEIPVNSRQPLTREGAQRMSHDFYSQLAQVLEPPKPVPYGSNWS